MGEVTVPITITTEAIATIRAELNALLPEIVYLDDYWQVEAGINSDGEGWESLILYYVGRSADIDVVNAQIAVGELYPGVEIDLRHAWWDEARPA